MTQRPSRPLLLLATAIWGALPLAAAPPAEPHERTHPREHRDLPAERARHNALLRQDEKGRVLSENRLRALRQACELPVDPSMAPSPKGAYTRSDVGPSVPGGLSFPGRRWESVGPQPMRSKVWTSSDYGFASGRITALSIHPSNPSVLLLGAATGGIWKSTDAGAHWRPVSDSAPALASSDIAFAPSNPSIVYAATGEADSADLEFRPSSSQGIYLGAGLLRSVDGGDSWVRVDAEGQLPTNAVLSRVVVHPNDPQLVLVGVYVWQEIAANRARVGGVYRSTDGGVTFTKTFAHTASDLQKDPATTDGVFAAFGVTGGCASCPDASGVYRSADFGQTWTASLVTGTPGATFASSTGNIKLGLTRTSPVTLYASVVDTKNSHEGGGIFRSRDGGATWQKVAVHPLMCPSAGLNQCSYDHAILPSPSQPDVVYFGAIDLFKSTNGGASWFQLTDVYGGGSDVHPDQHVLAIHASAPDTLWVGNDGGLYRSPDAGTTFENLNETLNLAQFNGIALDPVDPNFAMGGTQDNGNLRFTGVLQWTDRTGGDGGFNLIRQDDPNSILNGNFYSSLNYSADKGERFRAVDPTGAMGGDLVAFYPPCVAAPAAPQKVFFATTRIWANDTFGALRDRWVARSPAPITASGARIYALAVAGDGNGVIWAGTATELLYSQDGGATFVSRSAGTGLPSALVTDVQLASSDGTAAYVTFGGFTGGLPGKHVFKTVDAGVTWTNLSANLPDSPVLSLAIDPSDPGGLFAGTDVGVFRSTDGGLSWASFNQGLPNAAVTELEFHRTSGDLWASTYGRGIWRVPAAGSAPLPPVADFSHSPEIPAVGQSVRFTDLSTGEPSSWTWDFGDQTSSTVQSPTHAYSAAGSYTATLTAANAGGSSTRSRTFVVLGPSVCNEDGDTLCLFDGRFQVEATYRDYAGSSGNAQAVKLTPDSGYFWFFSSTNVELVAKIVSFCNGSSGNYALYASGLTDVDVTFKVTDTRTGVYKEYRNPLGNRFCTIADGPFTCASAPTAAPREASAATPATDGAVRTAPTAPTAAAPAPAEPLAGCTDDALTLCLYGGRFKVEAVYKDYGGNLGNAQAVKLTPDSGYFWFFSSSNVELVAKIVSFCNGSSGNYALYASGLTDVEVTFKVTDTSTGLVREYRNLLGNRFCTIADGPFSCP